MKKHPNRNRRAALLLLAAAALPFTPVLAQDTQPVPPAQPTDTVPPPAVPAPAPAPVDTAPVPAPVVVAPAPVAAAPPLVVSTAPASTPARRAPARAATRAQPRGSAPAPARAARTAPAEPVNPAPVEASAPPSTASNATVQPAPAPVAVPPPPTAQSAPVQQARTGSILPWLLAALAAIGAITFLLTRRRRARLTEDEAEGAPAPVAATAAAGAVPLAAQAGRPWIELLMRPVRAGVEDKDAVVEFELTVDNQGSAPAKDVRISTWMVAAGSESEAERALIERPAGKESAPVTIDSGDTRKIESAVALPTAGMEEDSVLPVVMAEARYRLPDGSEARTSASFEVGVPYGEELAHFAIDNPSGLHDDVEARMHREPERA
jgi:hypothetical protein